MSYKIAKELLDILIHEGYDLSEATCGEIMSRSREEIIPALIILLEQMHKDYHDMDGADAVPYHAATMLTKLNAVEAIEPFLRLLMVELEWEDDCSEFYRSAILSFGPLAMEPAIQAYLTSSDQEHSHWVADILGLIAVRDPRILSILLNVLEEDIDSGTWCLGNYGDPVALPAVLKALESCTPNSDLIPDIEWAIEKLGGTVPPRKELPIPEEPKIDSKSSSRITSLPRPGITHRFR